MSQPERFTYCDQQGKEHTYTPDAHGLESHWRDRDS
jgi:hypothetical protein